VEASEEVVAVERVVVEDAAGAGVAVPKETRKSGYL
jgi:hypothetical protein